ncbi:MAG: methyltransferase domain-containing protein [Candidatus Rokuibacteriota bacterium]
MRDPSLDRSEEDQGRVYDEEYYEHYHSASGLPYRRLGPWLAFFGSVADHIVKDISPRSALDVGCAKGFLVEALRDRGVEAYGLDVSDYAIGQVRPDIRPFCWIASATEPLPRRYDLITCLEVLEHLPEAAAVAAVANLCRAADDILFSSTPDDLDDDATHVNVRPVEHWAGLFAEHGFYRDVDFDVSFVALHAARFRRQPTTITALVRGYDRALWQRLQQADAARHRIQALQSEIATARVQAIGLEREWRWAEGERQHLANRIALMESTAGWMFLQRLRRLRDRIAPAGTARARAVRAASWRARTALRARAARARVGGAANREGALRKVLIVSGSSGDMERYRCHNAAEQLGLQGIDATVTTIGDGNLLELVPHHDVLLFHRVASADVVERLAALARREGIAVLMDVDDLVFDPEAVRHIDAVRWMDAADRTLFAEGVEGCRRSLLLCDGALVTTDALADAARRLGMRAWVHRNGPSLELLRLSEDAMRARPDDRGRVIVGYASGTRTHNRDFTQVAPALEQLLGEQADVDLWILGVLDLDDRWDRWGDRVRRLPRVPWRELPALLARLDVNLAPLEPDNPFCEAKSELKYIEAGAVGVPTVASDLGAFRHAIRDGDNGCLVHSVEGWLDALRRLVTDPELRRSMGRRAYGDVRARYHPAGQGPRLFRTLEAARGRLPEVPAAPVVPPPDAGPAVDPAPGPALAPEDALAHALLDGRRGLEIGAAAHNPFGLDTRNVAVPGDWEFYAKSQADLGVEAARVDIWASGDNIPVRARSQDFVISSHVVEHLPDLVGAFVEWDRVVRDGGHVYMIVPVKGALPDDGPRPLTPLDHFVDDWEQAAHTRLPRARWIWRCLNRLDGGLLWREHARIPTIRALARPVRARLLHGPSGLLERAERRIPWDRHSTDGVPGGRGGHYHTFEPDTIIALVEWMGARGLCDWQLTSREDVDGKVGNGFTLAFQVRHRGGSARRPSA